MIMDKACTFQQLDEQSLYLSFEQQQQQCLVQFFPYLIPPKLPFSTWYLRFSVFYGHGEL
jgi:hypothetical protein